MAFNKKPSKTKKPARDKMMDFLARRDHSEKELRRKLSAFYEQDEIEKAINYAKERRWLPKSKEDELTLAKKVADQLHRKKKGILYINSYLTEKGLPEVKSEYEIELEKAKYLVGSKLDLKKDKDYNEISKLKSKIGRSLVSKGFEMHIVRKVIYEK